MAPMGMAVAEHPLAGLGYTHPSASRPLLQLGDDGASPGSAIVAEEVPIALVYNGRPYVVVMGTPSDLEDLAVGFSRTEAVVDDSSQIERLDVVRASHGIELQIQIPTANAERLEARARALVSRTGCGLCGVETITDALRVPTPLSSRLTVTAEALWLAGAELSRQQTLNNETKTVHGAGWAMADGRLSIVREDVGRHNALDKLAGAIVREGRSACDGAVLLTSRVSVEMVQKAAMLGAPVIVAVSAPTALAIKTADEAGITLLAIARDDGYGVFTHPRRVLLPDEAATHAGC